MLRLRFLPQLRRSYTSGQYCSSLINCWTVKAQDSGMFSGDYDITAKLNEKCQNLSNDGWNVTHIVPFCDGLYHSTTTHFVVVAFRPTK